VKVRARRLLVSALLATAACSVSPPMPDPAPDHPASPAAAEAPRAAASATLRGREAEVRR